MTEELKAIRLRVSLLEASVHLLNGRTFGWRDANKKPLTWDDADDLLTVAELVEDLQYFRAGRPEKLRDLRDRIIAFLPPREASVSVSPGVGAAPPDEEQKATQ